MTPVRMTRLLQCAVAVIILSVTGCGKKASSQGTPGDISSAPPIAPAAADGTPSPEDQQVNERAITFIRTRVNQKDWASARQSLQALETRPLTAAQRETVNQLKSQIPSQ